MATPTLRWRFPSAAEAALRAQTHERIDSWWAAFQEQRHEIAAIFERKSQWYLPAWMAAHLQAIHPALMWEYGPALKGRGHRLVITPESSRQLRPLVGEILRRSPTIEGWEFYDYRVPGDVAQAAHLVQARTGMGIDGVQFSIAVGEHHQIDLRFRWPPVSGSKDELQVAAFVLSECLLGEQTLDKWIGEIKVEAATVRPGWRSLLGLGAARHMDGFRSLEELPGAVDSAIAEIRNRLPEKPLCLESEQATWTLWKLEPRPDTEFGQLDLFVARSMTPPMWTAAHCGAPFYSERFSRCGETFCYVKLDGADDLEQCAFADKAEIEDALDGVLKATGLGCQIGGGTGLRYSYVDLALVDVEKGIEAIRQRLREGCVTRRAWIQFFDAGLVAEWVGVYDDSPPPPMPSWD